MCEFNDMDCEQPATRLFGDLLVCPQCYRELSRTTINPRCPVCGYWQDTPGSPCGLPCL